MRVCVPHSMREENYCEAQVFLNTKIETAQNEKLVFLIMSMDLVLI